MKDINLLPERKKHVYGLYMFIPIFTIIVLIGIYFGVSSYMNLTSTLNDLERKIELTSELNVDQLNRLQNLQSEISEQNYLIVYERLISLFEQLYIPPEHILKELRSKLPQEARITNLQFDIGGTITLEAAFQQKEDAVRYMDALMSGVYTHDMYLIVVEEHQGHYRARFDVYVHTIGGEEQ